MNYKDVELMRQSFGDLSDTMLRNRELNERKSEHGDEMGLRQQELDQRASEEKDQKQELVETLKRNTLKFHEGQMKEITDMVADGSLSPEQGTQMLKGGAAKIDQWEKDESPVIAAFSSPDFKLQKTQDDSMPVAFTAGGKHGVYSKKTGKFELTDSAAVDTGKERNSFLEKILSDKDMTPEAQARALQTYDAQQKLSRPSAPAESSDDQPAAPTSSKYDIQVVSPGEGGQPASEVAPVAAPSSATPSVAPPAPRLTGSPILSPEEREAQAAKKFEQFKASGISPWSQAPTTSMPTTATAPNFDVQIKQLEHQLASGDLDADTYRKVYAQYMALKNPAAQTPSAVQPFKLLSSNADLSSQ
jgi:hypothetical protein